MKGIAETILGAILDAIVWCVVTGIRWKVGYDLRKMYPRNRS